MEINEIIISMIISIVLGVFFFWQIGIEGNWPRTKASVRVRWDEKTRRPPPQDEEISEEQTFQWLVLAVMFAFVVLLITIRVI